MTTKAEQAVRADPRIEEVCDERNYSGSIWAYLKPGFHDGYDEVGRTHAIHEDTWAAVKKQLRSIRPCDCNRCRTIALIILKGALNMSQTKKVKKVIKGKEVLCTQTTTSSSHIPGYGLLDVDVIAARLKLLDKMMQELKRTYPSNCWDVGQEVAARTPTGRNPTEPQVQTIPARTKEGAAIIKVAFLKTPTVARIETIVNRRTQGTAFTMHPTDYRDNYHQIFSEVKNDANSLTPEEFHRKYAVWDY